MKHPKKTTTKRKPKQRINAAAPAPGAPITLTGEMTLCAAAGENKQPTFEMVAYTGVKMRLARWGYPVVVALSGMTIPSQRLPVRLQHDADKGVGHTTKIEKTDTTLTAAGVISRKNAFADDVLASGREGFPWQVSIGAEPDEIVFVPEKQSAQANGKSFKGPFYLIAKSRLGELSFVDLGGDVKTSAAIAAQHQPFLEKEKMDIRQLKILAAGYKKKLTDEQIALAVLAAHEADEDESTFLERLEAMAVPAKEPPAATPPAVTAAGGGVSLPDLEKLVTAAVQKAQSGDLARQNAIRAAATTFGISPELTATLLSNPAMTVEAAHGEMLKEVHGRHVPSIAAVSGAGSSETPLRVIEAAAYLGCLGSEKKAMAYFGEPTLEAAAKLRISGFGELFEICAAARGVHLPVGRGINERIQAAFSGTDIADLLSNLANKTLLEAYMPEEEVWPRICKIGTVKDFKTASRHRLIGHFEYQGLGAGGELKHGHLSDQKWDIKATTKGILLSLTREMIINDDLNAFLDMFRMLGLGASDAINRDVWTLLEDNSDNFFHANNKNKPTAAKGNALSFESLALARETFRNQKQPNGRPLRVLPKTLLVPTALETVAEQLMASTMVLSTPGGLTETDKAKPVDNTFRGKYDVACSPDLTNAKDWYLFADPLRVAAIEVAFLNGQQNPTVERAEVAADRLGAMFRAFIDYGAAKQDPKGAVKMSVT